MASNRNTLILAVVTVFLWQGPGTALSAVDKPEGSSTILRPSLDPALKVISKADDPKNGPAGKTLATPPALPKPFKWHHSYSEGLKAARKEGLPILISFHAEWCGWCKMMDEETFADPKVLPRIRKFVCIKVDADREPNAAFAYQVSSLPRTFLVNVHDEIIGDYLGFRDVKDFLELLDAAEEYVNKKTGFAQMPIVPEGSPRSPNAPPEADEADLVTIDPKDKEQLFELLGHSNSRLRAKVVKTLTEQGSDAVPLLLKALEDDYLGTRISAWKALRGLKLQGVSLEKVTFDPWAPKKNRAKALAQLKGLFDLSQEKPGE